MKCHVLVERKRGAVRYVRCPNDHSPGATAKMLVGNTWVKIPACALHDQLKSPVSAGGILELA